MEGLEAKINQLVVETSENRRTFVRTFSINPPSNLRKKLGRIFGVVEIESSDDQIPYLIDLIIDELKENFYTIGAAPEVEPTGLSEKFETALKKVNLAIAAFLENQQISLNFERVNIVIALISGPDLHFTLVGRANAILFLNVARSNYRIIDILEASKTQTQSPEPLKIFSQVISGRLKPRDVFFISTTNIFDYFSLERIKNILTEKLPSEGIIELKRLIEEIGSNENFAGIALELEKTTVPIKRETNISEFNYREAASKDSINELLRTERETAKLLTPSIMPEIKKYAGSLKTAFQNYSKKISAGGSSMYKNQKNKIIPKLPGLPSAPSFPKIKKPKFSFGSGFEKITQTGKSSGRSLKEIIQPIITFVQNFTHSVARHPVWKNMSGTVLAIFSNLIIKVGKLPRSSKILLTISVMLGLMFLYSIVWLGIKNAREAKLEELNQIILEVESKKNEAEASLIFRDENLARELLVEARDSLVSLEDTSRSQQEKISILISEIEQQLGSLRHIEEIAEPVQVVNFQNLDSQANIARFMINVGSTVYSQNLNNQAIYKANLDTRVLSGLFTPDLNTGNISFGVSVGNNLIFFNSLNQPFQLSPASDSITPLSINLPENASLADAVSYNGRIYILDKANSQIYRYQQSGNSLGGQSNWISQTGLNLTDTTSLVVDGSVYILKKSGEVLKLQNGQTVEFNISTIDPAFKSPTKIKTSELSNFLYILDPPTNRLVVLDKDGGLVAQYISPQFTDLKDFSVNEARKEIYLLNGSAVFGIPASHL